MQDTIAALDYAKPEFDLQYMHCLTWINTECDQRELKAELVTYANTLGRADIAELVPQKRVGVEGKIAAARYARESKVPYLGICLGMQLMCSYSEENNTDCLGIFDEKVKRFSNNIEL